MTVVREPEPRETLDLEALIREARERQRRRRRRILAALVALAAAAGAVLGIVRLAGGGAPAIVHERNGPAVNVRAFAQHGTLAFVSRRTLWVLDGKSGSLRALTAPGFSPTRPMFSADGKWLAYLQRRPNAATARLWITRANGGGAHVVPGLEVYGLFGWSPAADVLAVSTGPTRAKGCPCFTPTTVRLVDPDGSVRPLAHAGDVYGAM